jgi:hypothetical protein
VLSMCKVFDRFVPFQYYAHNLFKKISIILFGKLLQIS